MKKVLLGTSALIGAAAMASTAFAGDAEVTVSGTVEFQYNYTDNDSGANDHGDIAADNSNTALFVNAKYKADNGLMYGAHIDYRVASSALDEGYIWFAGDWGRVHFGDDDGAVGNTTGGGETALAATGGYDGNALDNVATPAGFSAILTPSTVGTNFDASKIVYYTPNFNGFSGAVSYTPQNGGGTSGDGNGANAEDILEAAVQYNGDFDGIGINLNAGYRHGDAADNSGLEDISDFEVGGSVSYAGFKLAAGYGDSDDSLVAKGSDLERSFWNVGLGYDFGAGSVGIGYFNSEGEMTGGDDELEIFTIGGTYKVASGLTAFAEVNFLDMETASGADTDATNFILGSRVKF